jgi:hypothetical protein
MAGCVHLFDASLKIISEFEERLIMTSNKILPVALVAALLGGTVGGFVMHSSNSTPANDTAQALTQPARTTDISTDKSATGDRNALLNSEMSAQTKNMSDQERAAFRDGFIQGVNAACTSGSGNTRTASRDYYAPTSERVVYRSAGRTRYANSAPRRVYYDYGQPRGRSFWQKHRDKLTLAMGTGGGALLGGLIGGRKGAGIGALAGAGGSALYTYKLRRRHRNY